MTFLDRWAVAWLSSHGFRVAEPGTPDPADPAVAAKNLRGAGYRIFAPGVDLPVPPLTVADAKAALEGQHYTVLEPGEEPLYGLDRAVAALKAADYTVMPPRPAPEIGLWATEDGTHLDRWVLSISGDTVNYASGAEAHSCAINSFWKWRSKHKATHRPAATEPALSPVSEDAT